jgi:hypothetical protein
MHSRFVVFTACRVPWSSSIAIGVALFLGRVCSNLAYPYLDYSTKVPSLLCFFPLHSSPPRHLNTLNKYKPSSGHIPVLASASHNAPRSSSPLPLSPTSRDILCLRDVHRNVSLLHRGRQVKQRFPYSRYVLLILYYLLVIARRRDEVVSLKPRVTCCRHYFQRRGSPL